MSSEGEGLGSTFTVLLPMTGVDGDKTVVHPPSVLLHSSRSNVKASISSQVMQSHSQSSLTSLLCCKMGRRHKSQRSAVITTPQWNLPITMAQVKPMVRSNRLRNSSVNLRLESAVEIGKRELVTADVIRNESVLVRPFTSANMNKSQSDDSSLLLCNDFSVERTSSTDVVQALGKQNMEEYISDISEQRSHSGNLHIQNIRNALGYAEPRSPTRVLIVDDVAMNRKMLRRVLESRFDVIDEAEDGQKAVEIIAKSLEGVDTFLYDVITMDYQMPVMDGVTATRRIRSLGFLGKIIAVTGNALEEDVLTFKASGADAVLMKPLDIKLFDMIIKPNIPESK